MFRILLATISLTVMATAATPSNPSRVVSVQDLNCTVSNGVVLSTLSREEYRYTGPAIVSASYFGVWKRMATSYSQAEGDRTATITIQDRQTSYDLKLELNPRSREVQNATGTMYRTRGLGFPGLVGSVSCKVTLMAANYLR